MDPVGSLVGQRGVRVAVVTSELGGEKIDVVEWSANAGDFVKEALKPAQVMSIELLEDENRATVQVAEDQQSLAIGRGGQNVRLAARLTGWKIDIRSLGGEQAEAREAPTGETADELVVDAAVEQESDAEKQTEGTELTNPEGNEDRDIPSARVEKEQK